MTVQGSVANLSSALGSLTYMPDSGYVGEERSNLGLEFPGTASWH